MLASGGGDSNDDGLFDAMGIPQSMRASLAAQAADEVWPENMAPLAVFNAMQTQWRTGFGGATGLDYGVMPWVMKMAGVPREDRPDVFDAVRELELETLAHMRAKQ